MLSGREGDGGCPIGGSTVKDLLALKTIVYFDSVGFVAVVVSDGVVGVVVSFEHEVTITIGAATSGTKPLKSKIL